MFLLPILNLSFSLSPSHVQGSTRKDMRPVDYDENARALKSRFRTTTGMAESAFGQKVVELGVGNAFGEVGLELVDKPYRNANVISCSSRSCFAVMASADYRTLLGVHKQHMVFQPRQLQVRFLNFKSISPTHHCKPDLRTLNTPPTHSSPPLTASHGRPALQTCSATTRVSATSRKTWASSARL